MTRFLFTNSFDDFFNDYVFRDSTASMLYRIFYICRSSHRRCSVRKGALRNLAKFTGKHLCQSLFLKKTSGLQLIKKNLAQMFSFEFLRTPISQNTSEGLLYFMYKWTIACGKTCSCLLDYYMFFHLKKKVTISNKKYHDKSESRKNKKFLINIGKKIN